MTSYVDDSAALCDEYGSLPKPPSDKLDASVLPPHLTSLSLEDQYDIGSFEENDQYWEDIAGAALLELDRIAEAEETNWVQRLFSKIRNPSDATTLEYVAQSYEDALERAEKKIEKRTPMKGMNPDEMTSLEENKALVHAVDTVIDYADVPINTADAPANAADNPDADVTYDDIKPESDNVLEEVYRNIEEEVTSRQ